MGTAVGAAAVFFAPKEKGAVCSPVAVAAAAAVDHMPSGRRLACSVPLGPWQLACPVAPGTCCPAGSGLHSCWGGYAGQHGHWQGCQVCRPVGPGVASQAVLHISTLSPHVKDSRGRVVIARTLEATQRSLLAGLAEALGMPTGRALSAACGAGGACVHGIHLAQRLEAKARAAEQG